MLDPTRSHSQTRLLPQRGIGILLALLYFKAWKLQKEGNKPQRGEGRETIW